MGRVSIPSLATVFSVVYKHLPSSFCSILFQFHIQACRICLSSGVERTGPARSIFTDGSNLRNRFEVNHEFGESSGHLWADQFV
jgi:hypothetical protein